jgi:capsular polysaccharide transport system permease protein
MNEKPSADEYIESVNVTTGITNGNGVHKTNGANGHHEAHETNGANGNGVATARAANGNGTHATNGSNGVHATNGTNGTNGNHGTNGNGHGPTPVMTPLALNERAQSLAARRAEMAQRRSELMAAATIFSNADPMPPQVAPMAHPSAAPQKQSVRPKRKSHRKLWLALFVIALPTLAASIYYGKYASDQYLAVADFSIISPQSGGMKSGGGSVGSMMGGGGGGSTAAALAEQYIVRDYVGSLQMLQDIRPYLDVRKIYSNPKADALVRLNPNVTDEQLLPYWNGMVTVNFDMTTGLSEVRVRAFTPEDAKAVADRVLQLSEALVNHLSERARADAIRLAKNEVQEAYDRAVKSRDALEAFSKDTQQIDPGGFAKANSDIQTGLGQDLVTSESELNLLRKSLPEDAPGIVQLKNRIAVTEAQLATERGLATGVGTPGGGSANEVLTNFGRLNLENDLADQAYTSALTYQQSVELETSNQSCYLEAFVQPELPQYPQYPQRLCCVLLVALCGTVAWAILSLLFAAILDHA